MSTLGNEVRSLVFENVNCDSAPSSDLASSVWSPEMASPGASASGSIFGDFPTVGKSSRNSPAEWRIPNVIEAQASDYPDKLAGKLDAVLGCAVWLIQRDHRGKIVRRCQSQSAAELMVSPDDMESIASDTAVSSAPLASHTDVELPASPSAVMDQVWTARPGTGSMAVGLPSVHGSEPWVAVLAWRNGEDKTQALRMAAWLDLNAPRLGETLEAWSLQQSGLRRRKRVTAFQSFLAKPMRWIGIGLFACFGLLFVPYPYRPVRKCTIEPGSRRYIASPIEGRLKSVLVRPGDEVKAGQLLAKLDDAQIIRDLSSAQAEFQTHSKKRDVALAARAHGDMRIAQLECTQAQLKIESLTDQLQRLEIISPADGIVVQGDWFGNEGMPVSFGQSLFEVAPLDRMIAEMQLNADDLPWIRVGTKAVLRAEIGFGKSWQGTVERLEPRAEIIDEHAVFIAEMEVDNAERLFRPGMRAEVVVNAGTKSIGWILFRKPYRWLQNQWVW
jgi:multidrug efflux pump subunit AcrA (membrane-fusion protein)